MTSLHDVTSAYAAAESASIYVVSVESDAVRRLAELHQYFKKQARAVEDELAQTTESVISRTRWRLMTNVLPLDSEPLALQASAEALEPLRQAAGTGTEFGERCREAAAVIAQLVGTANPLEEPVLELLQDAPEGQRVLAVRSPWVPETRSHLAGLGVETPVIRHRALHDCPIVETMACIGPPRLFPPAARTAARADSVCFVEFAFEHSDIRPGGLFEEAGSLMTPVIRLSGSPTSRPRDLEPFDIREESRKSLRRLASGPVEGTGDPVEAVLLLLANGYAVWTEADDHNTLQCLDIDGEAPRLSPRKVGALAEDDHIILRADSADPDYIKTTADLFGAAQLRHTQDEWKQALRRAVSRAGGPKAAELELQRLGVRARNLRYWMGSQCISPRSRSDFLGLARFSGTEPELAAAQWDQLQEILALHIRAGHFVRAELEKRITEVGVEMLRSTGQQRYEIEHCGQLDAFRVSHVDPAEVREVPASRIDRPFQVPEDTWHG